MFISPNLKDIAKAGIDFMQQPTEVLRELEKEGYRQNIVACYDHFEVNCGEKRLFPNDFSVEKVIRFENDSDPDDQSILYAISSPKNGVKGIFLESYGLYHEDFSAEMLQRLCEGLHVASREWQHEPTREKQQVA